MSHFLAMQASRATPLTDEVKACLAEVEAFAAARGIKPETVVRQATGNPRLYDRLPGHSAKLERQVESIRAWIKGKVGSSDVGLAE